MLQLSLLIAEILHIMFIKIKIMNPGKEILMSKAHNRKLFSAQRPQNLMSAMLCSEAEI